MTLPNETENASRLAEILKRLNVVQVRFCVARCEARTDKEAAETIGITQGVVKGRHDDGAKDLVDEAVRLMAYDGVITALEIRRRNLAKAMAIKASGLESPNEKIRQDAATELIEWELGKAIQRNQNDNNTTIRIDGIKELIDKIYGARSE